MAGPVKWCSPDNHTCSFVSRPFVKAVRKNKTPMPLERVAEGWFLRGGFTHRVDGFQTKRLIFCPVWNETPTHEAEDTSWLRRMLAYGGNLLGRGDVPAWLPRRIFVEAEVVP